MKNLLKHILRLVEIFLVFVVFSQIGRAIFTIVHHSSFVGVTASEIVGVFTHGLIHDMSVAGYLSIIPVLMLMVSIFTGSPSKFYRWLWYIYSAIVSLLLAAIFVGDLTLYSYWNFRLDFTAIFYLFTSFKDAFASVSPWVVVVGGAIILIVASILYSFFIRVFLRPLKSLPSISCKIVSLLAMLLLAGVLFIAIRGGVSPTVMNPSKVYFSENQRINHAAINPAFNLAFSISHQTDFGSQFRFMEKEKAKAIMDSLLDSPELSQVPDVLTGECRSGDKGVPDVILVMLESFSTHLMPSMGGENIAVNLDRIASEGLMFTNFYANSFRTDRATPAVFSGFPSQPTTSIMKHTDKIENIYSIPKTLKEHGWNTAFYYGGDTHFTNLLAYLYACRFDKIISQSDFSSSDNTGRWGVNDRALFSRFLQEYTSEESDVPRFRIIQTSSSHEPFDVPDYNVFEDKRVNAFSYTDACLGEFVDSLKHSGKWDDILMLIVADHYAAYPSYDSLDILQRHHIPFIMTGGALALKGKNDRYASQVDIAATLLHQLGVPHDEFSFSKNIFNSASADFAFFTEVSAAGLVSKENQYVFNIENESVILDTGEKPGLNADSAKAYLQTLYDAIDAM